MNQSNLKPPEPSISLASSQTSQDNYKFNKSGSYTAVYYKGVDTIHINIEAILSFSDLIDSIYHEEMHRALFKIGLRLKHHHKAMQITESYFFNF